MGRSQPERERRVRWSALFLELAAALPVALEGPVRFRL